MTKSTYNLFFLEQTFFPDFKFAAFVVTDQINATLNKDIAYQGSTRLLGECTLELGPISGPLTEISGSGVRQSMKFIRMQNQKQVTVGRFIVNLKLVGEEMVPQGQTEYKQLDNQDIFHELPRADPFFDFVWRVRLDIRSANDIPMNQINNGGLPTTFAECGWVPYENQQPQELDMFISSLIENNRHPIWNCQFLIANTESMQKREGFIYLCFRDKYTQEPIDTFFLPIEYLKPFLPMNLELITQKEDCKPRYFISLCLETGNSHSFIDGLTDIAIHKVNFDPLPYSKRMFLIMTLNGYQPQQVSFAPVEMQGQKTAAKIMQERSNDQQTCFISTLLQIPAHQLDDVYKSVAIFTLPKSFLDKNVRFFVAGRDESIVSDHSFPNTIVGQTDPCDNLLKQQLNSQKKNPVITTLSWRKDVKIYPIFSPTRCQIEFSVFDQQDQKQMIVSQQFPNQRPSSSNDKLADIMGVQIDPQRPEKEKWQILAQELSQKQEIVHRMIRELDDKSESLKLTGAEIVDLRRQIKLLQSENHILRKRLSQEEQIEVQSIITKEIAMMNNDELRNKIIKLAQAYRDERIRNEDFQKALKNGQKEISQARQLEHEMEILQKKHAENSKKVILLQQELQKTQLYKETIKKQEKVIQKLEKLIEQTLKDTQKARKIEVEMEQLRSENLQLKMQTQSNQGKMNSNDGEFKNQIQRLQKRVQELEDELRSKRPPSASAANWENEKTELEIKLYKAQSRVDSMQEELTENAKNFGKEIAMLKLRVAEKQALIDTMTLGY